MLRKIVVSVLFLMSFLLMILTIIIIAINEREKKEDVVQNTEIANLTKKIQLNAIELQLNSNELKLSNNDLRKCSEQNLICSQRLNRYVQNDFYTSFKEKEATRKIVEALIEIDTLSKEIECNQRMVNLIRPITSK